MYQKIYSLVGLFILLAGTNFAMQPVRVVSETIPPYNVGTLADTIASDGSCSLREAIININSGSRVHTDCYNGDNPMPDRINFGGGTITLGSQLPTITRSMTIVGVGVAIINGNNTVRAFVVQSGVILTLNHVTVQNGSMSAGNGGGILNQGTLWLTNSNISDSTAQYGGGLFNDTTGTATVTNSTFTGNTATRGGGIYNYLGTMTVIGSTLTDNTATNERGGGIMNYSATLTVSNSTLSGNSALDHGGGIFNQGTLTMTHSTLSGNSAGDNGGTLYNEVGGIANLAANIFNAGASGGICTNAATLNDNGYNLASDTSCNFSGTGSQDNAALNLGALADNGGLTQTHLPGMGSAALELIPYGTTIANGSVSTTCNQNSEPLDTDQRGQPRPAAPTADCDAGAVELLYCQEPSNITTVIYLDQCIQWANLTAGPQTLELGADIILRGEMAHITSEITLIGNGHFISGNDMTRAFNVEIGGNLALDAITIKNGYADYGAAILNRGSLAVTNSTLSGNYGGSGSGICNGQCGIPFHEAVTSITNSTLSGNYTEGVLNEGGVVTVVQSTIFGNSAGISNQSWSGGSVYLVGTILSQNGSNCSGDNVYALDYTLSDDDTCGSLSGPVNINLGPLTDNGGPTWTHALGANSAAIDIIPNGTMIGIDPNIYTCDQGVEPLDTDQRGQPRPASAGGSCDAGAVETRDVTCLAPSDINTVGELNDCILWANGTLGSQTLGLGSDITLGADLPAIRDEMTIDGNGYFVSGNNLVRVFTIAPTGTLALDDIVVKNGNSGTADGGGMLNWGSLVVTDSSLINNSAGWAGGGGILNYGTLTIIRSTLSGNSAYSRGGAIHNLGTLMLIKSTLSGNSAYYGSGIYNETSGSDEAVVSDSTFSGNTAQYLGGGIYNYSGDLTLTHDTLTGNSSPKGSDIFNDSYGKIYLAGTILNNSTGGSNCFNNAGTVTDNGHNLSNDGSCSFSGTGSHNNASLNLGPLADNGGTTQTHMPGAGSAAIDLIPNGTTITNRSVSYTCNQNSEPLDTDQRGLPRPSTTDGDCDAGAVEVVAIAPAVPILLLPIDNSFTADTTPDFDWGDATGANEYQIQVDDNDNFSSPVIDTTVSISAYIPPSPLPDDTYYWHVRAGNGVWSDYSARWSFTIMQLPAGFSKISPTDGATNRPSNLTLSWGASSNAVSYEYCINTVSSCTAPGVWISTGTNTSVSLSGLTPGTRYWQVRARNSWGTTYANGNSTAWWSFTILPSPGAFNKSSPINGAINQPANTTLRWGASSSTISYEYCINTTASCTAPSSWVSTGTSTSVALIGLTPGIHYWQVRARNASGTTYAEGSSAAWWSFTVLLPPGAFNKTSPANGATNQLTNPTLTWGASSGASYYQYCINTTASCTAPSTWISTGSATSKALSGLTPGVTYYWQVRARNATGLTYAQGSSAAWWSFTVLPLPGAFNKITPTNGVTNRPTNLTLSWGAGSSASDYQYCINTTASCTASATWISTGINTSVTLSGLKPYTTYYWQVRARNASGMTYANGSSAAWWSFKTAPLSATFQSVGIYDGWVRESSAGSGVGGSVNATSQSLVVGDDALNRQFRSILSFDTASLLDTAVITQVIVKVMQYSLVGTNPFTVLGGLNVDIRKPYFGTTVGLVASDFQAAASMAGVGTFGAVPASGWYTANLGSTANPYINLTGTTQFRLRFATASNNNNVDDYLQLYSGNATTAANRPVLIIKYYVP